MDEKLIQELANREWTRMKKDFIRGLRIEFYGRRAHIDHVSPYCGNVFSGTSPELKKLIVAEVIDDLIWSLSEDGIRIRDGRD